jgi:hypothetical protein
MKTTIKKSTKELYTYTVEIDGMTDGKFWAMMCALKEHNTTCSKEVLESLKKGLIASKGCRDLLALSDFIVDWCRNEASLASHYKHETHL